jgi:hypothetical protein
VLECDLEPSKRSAVAFIPAFLFPLSIEHSLAYLTRSKAAAHESSSNRRARLLALTGEDAPKLPWCWIGNEDEG